MDQRRLGVVPAMAVACLTVAPLTSAAPAEGSFAGPGEKLYYEVKGTALGRPFVVVNRGPGFDHSQLLVLPAAWDVLARSRRVIFYDQRGTVRSLAEAGAAFTPPMTRRSPSRDSVPF
jgi:pimeloyl-ACP methyl ester carboxylesterase